VTRTQPLSKELPSVYQACRILADPTRLAILDLLRQGVQCNCVFGDRLGLPMNLVSHHLKVLRRAGLVSIARNPEDARWICYSLNPAKIAELRGLIDSFLGKEVVAIAST
jgi:ArsR family transcriptional regulator